MLPEHNATGETRHNQTTTTTTTAAAIIVVNDFRCFYSALAQLTDLGECQQNQVLNLVIDTQVYIRTRSKYHNIPIYWTNPPSFNLSKAYNVCTYIGTGQLVL